jgi:N-acyl-phosphatidylethanolamine-hydrolysing phospholipase D
MRRSPFGIPFTSFVLMLSAALGQNACLLFKAISGLGGSVASPSYLAVNPILKDPELAVLWIGHASVLIQIHDKIFLTDPVFTRTVGMLSQRLIAPGLDPKTLPRVDYTLISHLHFDHYNFGSLDKLPKKGSLLLPLGALRYTPDFGFTQIRELNAWEWLERDGVRITAVPVQHFGGRYGLDMAWMQDTGYTGYVIEYRGVTVFFAGDTGYEPKLFKTLGQRFKIDLALLPIGPVEPRDVMSRVHTNPAEALRIMADSRARYMVPIHHSTFVQGYDPTPESPLQELTRLLRAQGKTEQVVALKVGEQCVFRNVAD